MEEYVHTTGLGDVIKNRAEWARDNGLLGFFEGEYILTSKAMNQYTNFFKWVTGINDCLFDNPKFKHEQPVIETKTRGKLTQSAIDDLFSSLS
jgi:hypothetical protein